MDFFSFLDLRMAEERYITESRPGLSLGGDYYVVVDRELEKDIGYYHFKDQADRIANELNTQFNSALTTTLNTSSTHK